MCVCVCMEQARQWRTLRQILLLTLRRHCRSHGAGSSFRNVRRGMSALLCSDGRIAPEKHAHANARSGSTSCKFSACDPHQSSWRVHSPERETGHERPDSSQHMGCPISPRRNAETTRRGWVGERKRERARAQRSSAAPFVAKVRGWQAARHVM